MKKGSGWLHCGTELGCTGMSKIPCMNGCYDDLFTVYNDLEISIVIH